MTAPSSFFLSEFVPRVKIGSEIEIVLSSFAASACVAPTSDLRNASLRAAFALAIVSRSAAEVLDALEVAASFLEDSMGVGVRLAVFLAEEFAFGTAFSNLTVDAITFSPGLLAFNSPV